ncbi:MAG: cupin domain-containing protein [Candidatus Bathyarchaeota archaeon]|nr:cupin domain-containing protein [Candidatus Bathyarchaeota archaeon]
MSIVKNLAEIPETTHPFLAKVGMSTLYSRRDDGAELTCFVVRCKVGSEIEEHVHPDEADIIYVLAGKATMWIEDRGEFPLDSGVFVVVPKDLKHRTYDVTEELLIYDVFYPAMF